MPLMAPPSAIAAPRQPLSPGCAPARAAARAAAPAARRNWRAAAAPTWNPQNTDQPRVLPSPAFSPEEAVRAQLDALAACDDPWPSHGIHLAYEFGYDIGGLDPSRYFGFPKDLYHLDHFMGQMANHLPELINAEGYDILEVAEAQGPEGEEEWQVVAEVRPGGAPGQAPVRFRFHLRRKRVGTRKGALMTAMIKREAA